MGPGKLLAPSSSRLANAVLRHPLASASYVHGCSLAPCVRHDRKMGSTGARMSERPRMLQRPHQHLLHTQVGPASATSPRFLASRAPSRPVAPLPSIHGTPVAAAGGCSCGSHCNMFNTVIYFRNIQMKQL